MPVTIKLEISSHVLIFIEKDEIKKTKSLTPSIFRSKKPVALTPRRAVRNPGDPQLKGGDIKID